MIFYKRELCDGADIGRNGSVRQGAWRAKPFRKYLFGTHADQGLIDNIDDVV